MKKYMIPIAVFLLTGGLLNAQSTAKKTGMDTPVGKMVKPAAKKTAVNTATVSPTASATAKKTNTNMVIKRKHPYKKTKSVKPAGSQ